MREVLIYTVHKAASMFLHRPKSDVAHELQISHHSTNYDKDHDLIHKESWRAFIQNEPRTGCFGPIRAGTAEPYLPERVDSYRIVLQLRDPRDVLTSVFFSHTYGHPRQSGRFDPTDEWTLLGPRMAARSRTIPPRSARAAQSIPLPRAVRLTRPKRED